MLQAAVLGLSQGCFLGWEGWGGDDTCGVAKGQRFVSVDYAKKLIPKPPGSAKRKKQTPSWVVVPQMAPQSPQKENKGSDPHFASASRERKAQGGWRLVEQSLLDGFLTEPWPRIFLQLLQFRIQIFPTGVCGWSHRPCNTVKN